LARHGYGAGEFEHLGGVGGHWSGLVLTG
jgi:hypothetical protein